MGKGSVKPLCRDLVLIQQKYADLPNSVDEDPRAPIDPITYVDSNGDSLLHIAAWRGDAETVETLLKLGVGVNMLGDMSSTALHYAYRKGRADVVKVLLSHGASTTMRDEFGNKPDESLHQSVTRK